MAARATPRIVETSRLGRAKATLVVVAAVTTAGGVLLHRPVLLTQPLFTVANTATTTAMVTLGGYLVLRQRERFTGLAFVAAGLSWLLIAFDIYPGWGGWIAFVLGAGASFYTPLCWGVLRFGRPRLTRRSERAFLPLCALLTSGTGAVYSLFVRPEWIGLAPSASWPTLWPDQRVAAAGGVVLCAGFAFLAGYFVVLVRGLLREAPPTRRDTIRPLCLFGVAIGAGSAAIFTVSTPVAHLLPFHVLSILIAALALVTTAGLFVAITRQDLFLARLVALLPSLRTPDSVSGYLKAVLRDDSAELLFWDVSSAGTDLIDLHGHRRPLEHETGSDRFHQWLFAGDGEQIALLVGNPLLGNDLVSLASVQRVVSILAENTRLQAVLRMGLAQVTAMPTAQELALEQARESFRRDLHDGLQQTVAAARMDLDGLADASPPGDGPSLVTALSAKLDLALEQVHGLQRGARPPELRFGLKPALERTVAELRLPARCQVTDADLGILTVPVYYLVRESLTNAHKHARARSIEVEVRSDGRTVEIAVRDDGVGGAEPRERGGIDGMRPRVEALGGDLRITSPTNVGTLMRASLPCVSW